jgi:hypothetical protein
MTMRIFGDASVLDRTPSQEGLRVWVALVTSVQDRGALRQQSNTTPPRPPPPPAATPPYHETPRPPRAVRDRRWSKR